MLGELVTKGEPREEHIGAPDLRVEAGPLAQARLSSSQQVAPHELSSPGRLVPSGERTDWCERRRGCRQSGASAISGRTRTCENSAWQLGSYFWTVQYSSFLRVAILGPPRAPPETGCPHIEAAAPSRGRKPKPRRRYMSSSREEPASSTFVLLYGPLVQFSRAAGTPEPTVVAMPPALPLSVNVVYRHPPDSSPPDSLAHFCFCPLLKLHEPSELSFCLTDSSGHEMYGVSLQLLCRHEAASAPAPETLRRASAGEAPPAETRVRHRPIALVMLSSRPFVGGFASTLRSLAPLVQRIHRTPTAKEPVRMEVRVGRDAVSGLGLVLNPTNTVMQVEAGSIAARERRLRPGDVILSIDGTELAGARLSEVLASALQEEEAAHAGGVAENSNGGSNMTRHMLGIRRTHERLLTGEAQVLSTIHHTRRTLPTGNKKKQTRTGMKSLLFPSQPARPALSHGRDEQALVCLSIREMVDARRWCTFHCKIVSNGLITFFSLIVLA